MKRILILLFVAMAHLAAGPLGAAESSAFAKLFDVQLKIAKAGDAEGQYYLGEMYENGLGTKRDLDQAFTWYAKAADQGHPLAKRRMEQEQKIRAETSRAAQESARRQSELSRLKAEAEQAKAEAERARVQAEKARAEAERAKADAERARKAQSDKPVVVQAKAAPEKDDKAAAAAAAAKAKELARVEAEVRAKEKAERDAERDRVRALYERIAAQQRTQGEAFW